MKFRIIAAVLAVICGGLYGINRSEKLKQNVGICLESEKLFRITETMIRSSRTDVYTIFSILKHESFNLLAFVNKLPDEYSAESDLHTEWKELILKETNIPGEERSVLLDFGSVLGTCDTDGQMSGIEVCRELMKECYNRRSSEYHTKAKLFRSLGILAGVMVGIIVI